MNDNTKQSGQTTEINLKEKFYEAGFSDYFDVLRALHLFQTEVANDIKEIMERKRERINSAIISIGERVSMGEIVREIGPSISPTIIPNKSDLSYEKGDCNIGVGAIFGQKNFWIHLGVRFSDPIHVEVILEVPTRNKSQWQSIFNIKSLSANHLTLVDEPWDGWAVGLRCPLKSSANLKAELETLLNEFLTCIESKKT